MRISRFFTAQPLDLGLNVSLNHSQSHYITHVLRLKAKQEVIIFNGSSQQDYLSTITKVGKTVELHPIKCLITNNEPPIKTTLYQALSKFDHMDVMIQKTTELGINHIIIFNSERTQTPLKTNKFEKKLHHWQRIAQSACEQCGRSLVPSIQFFSKLPDALTINPADIRIMLDFDGNSLSGSLSGEISSIDILLGAEGGLSKHEILLATQQCFKKVRLGPRVLRTETAAISALSLVQLLSGDLK